MNIEIDRFKKVNTTPYILNGFEFQLIEVCDEFYELASSVCNGVVRIEREVIRMSMDGRDYIKVEFQNVFESRFLKILIEDVETMGLSKILSNYIQSSKIFI